VIHLAQPLTHLCLAFIAGLEFLTCACFLVDGDREIPKSGVAELKILISFFTARVICEKLMPCNISHCSVSYLYMATNKIGAFTSMALKTAT
jgi:hypothetical protein